MALHALELTLDPASDVMVRRLWGLLAAAGLPSQARHTGATNAPHLTVASAPAIASTVEQDATVLLGPLLPARMPVAGLTVLGRRRLTLALLVTPGPAVVAAVHQIRATISHTTITGALASAGSSPWLADTEVGTPESSGSAHATTQPENGKTWPQPAGDRRPWVGHVTVARGLTPAQLAAAVEILTRHDPVDEVTADTLRRWDPDTGTVRRLRA